MKRSFFAALVAVALAAVGCAALLAYAHTADKRALDGQKGVRVLVASKKIPAGTTGQAIRDGGYTEVVTMPAATVPADALSTIDGSLLAQAVTADQQPRQLLLRGVFDAPATRRAGLPVPDGMLAVSVSMRVPAEVAGYVQPGQEVAVFDTFTVNESKSPDRVPAGDGLSTGHGYNQATRLLLPKVEILAIGGRGTPGAADVGPRPTATPSAGGAAGSQSGQPADGGSVLVTVAVNQDQAQRLVHSAQTGALYLALLGDGAEAKPGPGVDNYSLFQ
ncbi:hypothetical protein HC031_28255 [Planosporangium thailandense]|uniref:Flp pilus assembly protein RcpC/CpaB domain-containing protein n=1 Tax=Planosporangium thailandense TaxID=765197 RepID=A0ABX0Y5A6_9ACTN|nr:RcpC/CpaB family pilus assembly protein [Planosporangium thailandense]NJC73590.1 hypothetical protein [Planosporangium thailandense]